jgi:hypothetical protein
MTIQEALYQAKDDYANMLEKTLANEVIRLREELLVEKAMNITEQALTNKIRKDCGAAEAESDRYKNALTRIATIRMKGYEAQRIAREAIKEQV